jgi:hypothetical protein
VTVITVVIAPLLVERAKVAGVTENAAEAMTLVAPEGSMSTKYPPPTTSGTLTVVDIPPPLSEVTDSTPSEQLVTEVLKQIV